MLVYLYSRKSVYTGKGESIENQVEMCKQYIFREIEGVTPQDIFLYEDEGFSGKTLERPQFQKMMEDMKRQKPDYLVCYRLDRISRSVSDFAPLIEKLNHKDIHFICIKEKFDTSTPMGKAMMYIASVFAQLERETIAERVRDNMLLLARTGRWLGGTTPTGFDSEKVEEVIWDGKKKYSCKLRFHPEEIQTVRLMFQKFQELGTVSGVGKYLMRQKIHSRTGKPYSLLGIKEILQNPVYCIADQDALAYFRDRGADLCFDQAQCSDQFGLITYNKRDYKKKAAPRQPMERWIIAVGKHKGILSGSNWVAVQEALAHTASAAQGERVRNDYSLLSGLIYCTQCGEKLFSKPRSNSTELFDYLCSSKIRGGRAVCGCPNLNGKQTDHLVLEWLLASVHEDSGIYPLLEQLKKELSRPVKADPTGELKRRIAACNAEIDCFLQSLAQPGLSPPMIQRVNGRITALDQELSQLHLQLQAKKGDANKSDSQIQQVEALARSLCCFQEIFDQLELAEKRRFLRLVIRKIEWDGDDLHLFLASG